MRQVERKTPLRLPQPERPHSRDAGEVPITATDRVLAWMAHLFTASGTIFGLLALFAILEHAWLLAFVWMAAALAVDAADGTLARRWQVRRVLPRFDGGLLDNLVDFLTYVIVPAIFLYQAGLLPPGMEVLGAGIITLASAYQFCQEDAKTEDHYFKGFPSYWNAVVFYLFFLDLPPAINLAVVVLLAILVFVPIHYAYPSRMPRYRGITVAATLAWGISCLVVLAQYPEPSPLLLWLSLLYIPFYVGVSLYSRHRDRVAL